MRLVRQRLNTFYAAVKLPSLYQLRGLGKFDPVDRDDRRITFAVALGGDEQGTVRHLNTSNSLPHS